MSEPGAPPYTYGGESVNVDVHLTREQFRHVENLLGWPPGNYKEWSSSYVFEPASRKDADAVCAYLREQGIPHERETVAGWKPPR